MSEVTARSRLRPANFCRRRALQGLVLRTESRRQGMRRHGPRVRRFAGRTARPGGRRLAAAGTAAFGFDYRHFGASDGQPREQLDIDRQLDDWHAAIAYVRDRGGVDPDLVGLWGSSLSGGQVLCVGRAIIGSRRSSRRCPTRMATRWRGPRCRAPDQADPRDCSDSFARRPDARRT